MVQFRRLAALVDLSVRATGGAAVQGTGRLLLPILLRQPGLREPAQKQEGAVLFTGLSASTAARRLAPGGRSGASTTLPYEP